MMNQRFKLTFSAAVLAVSSVVALSADAGIINGDFSIPLTDANAGWQTVPALGDPPVSQAEQAKFEIGGFFEPTIQLEQTFLLPSNVVSLSFEYLLSIDPIGTVSPAPYDTFQASLLDPFTFAPLLSVSPGEDRFFGIDAGGNPPSIAAEVSPPEVLSNGFTRITLDVSSLASQEVLLDFFAFGEDDNLTTTVLLDNVVLSVNPVVVPEPTALAIWGLLGLTNIGWAGRRRRIETP